MFQQSGLSDLQAAQQGDPDALSRLLARHSAMVRAAVQIQPHWQSLIDPDDILQVTYAEAFLRIGSFSAECETAFGHWLAVMARNNLRDAIRALEAEKRPDPRKRVDNGEGYLDFAESLGVTTSTPSRAASRQEIKAVVEQALGMIPADYAQAVRLIDLEGLPSAAVAVRLQRSRGAVVMLAVRGRARLREVFGSGTRFFSGSGH